MDFGSLNSMFARMMASHEMDPLRDCGSKSDRTGPTIRDLDDDGDCASKSSPVSAFDTTLQLQERSSSYLKEGKYEEAYGLVKKQYKLGSKVHFIPVLVNYYATLMHTDRPEKALKIRAELATLLDENFENSPEDVANYGDKLRKQNKLFEAILFYQVASNQCKKHSKPCDAISALQSCALGTKFAVMKLMECYKTSKLLVKKHIIPPMHQIIDLIGYHANMKGKFAYFIHAVCLHHVEHCEFLIGDLKARETSIKKSIDLMKQHFGNDAKKYNVFGGYLSNLGHTYMLQDRPNEAVNLLEQAIAAKQKAEDYDTAAEKRKDIEDSQCALQLARRKI